MSHDHNILAKLDEARDRAWRNYRVYPHEVWPLAECAAAEIRRLRAELEGGHEQMDKAGIPRDWGGDPMGLGQRIDLKLQALADMIEIRDDWVVRLRARVAELAEPLTALVAAKDEKDAHGETDQYRQFEAGAWDRARAAVRADEEDS